YHEESSFAACPWAFAARLACGVPSEAVMHLKRLLRLAPALLLILLAGCERHLPTSSATFSKPGGAVLDRSAVQSRGLGAQHFAGEIGPGALYTIDVPESWNGDLVVYAHGYTLPQLPVGIPSGPDGFGGVR